MPYIYLLVSVFMNASASIFGKFFEKNNNELENGTKLYNCVQGLCVFLVWGILYIFDFSFDVQVLPYCLLFAICFTLAQIGIINALRYGPTTLTTLFISLSLIVTTIWGFIFWNTKITYLVVIGIILVVIAIYFCLYTSEKEQKKISWKWIIFVLMAFFGNAGCSIVQRTQQMQFDGHHKYMFMAVATLLSAIACLVIYLLSSKKNSNKIFSKSVCFPIMAGICNVVLNLFVMLLVSSSLSPSLIYPVIGVGGLMIVTLTSIFVFKEKLKHQQWFGIIIGAIATVILSI